MRYPLIGLCICFCLGIWLGAYLNIPFFVFYLLAFLSLILSIIFIRTKLKFSIFLSCFVFLLGASFLKNSQVLPKNHIANFTPYKSRAVSLVGVIDNDPIYKKGCVSFILGAEKLKVDKSWQKISGKVLVRVFSAAGGSAFGGNKGEFFYGDRLLLEGRLYRPPTLKGFNYRDYLKRKHIYSILSVKKDSVAKQLSRSFGNPLKSFAFKLRHRVKDVFAENLSVFSSGILNAIILGERENLSNDVKDALVKTGTVHVIAISGLHLGIVAVITLVILKVIRLPRRMRYILTIFFLIVYCLLTGARTPVVRATVMAVILLFGYLLGRGINIYNSLSLAALVILGVNPSQIFEVSFQLSFLSVIFIVLLTPKIQSIFSLKLQRSAFFRFLILAFCVSTAAWLGLLPLIAYYFKIFTPVTVLANMVIIPYMSIIVGGGFALALCGLLIAPLASLFGASCELFILILFKLNSLFLAIPGAYLRVPNISFHWVLIYYLLILFIFNLPKISSVYAKITRR